MKVTRRKCLDCTEIVEAPRKRCLDCAHTQRQADKAQQYQRRKQRMAEAKEASYAAMLAITGTREHNGDCIE